MNQDNSSVRVAVRVRPFVGSERFQQCEECVQCLNDDRLLIGTNKQFTFDYVFSPQCSQSQVIQKTAVPLLDAFMQGYNTTILAYGQTGSGKTYTMGTSFGVSGDEESLGIIPKCAQDMFSRIDKLKMQHPSAEFMLRVSFAEIYGEEIKDLLNPDSKTKISLREGKNGDIQLIGITEQEVATSEELMAVLERGTLCRTTASTMMNAHSSRSHAIFNIILEQKLDNQTETGGENCMENIVEGEKRSEDIEMESESQLDTANEEYITSKFCFVDLAGSERAKRTQAVGKTLKEGININKGLLALGNVISALGDPEKSHLKHIPYRDSKLTRILQDSLGGNSRTLMIACVSPADINFEETLNTLRYANRARNIKNKPIVNRDSQTAQLAQLREQIRLLKQQLLVAKGHPTDPTLQMQLEANSSFLGILQSSSIRQNTDEEVDMWKKRHLEAEEEVKRLSELLKELRKQNSSLADDLIQSQATVEFLRFQQRESNHENSGDSQVSVDLISGYLSQIRNLESRLTESQQQLLYTRNQLERSQDLFEDDRVNVAALQLRSERSMLIQLNERLSSGSPYLTGNHTLTQLNHNAQGQKSKRSKRKRDKKQGNSVLDCTGEKRRRSLVEGGSTNENTSAIERENKERVGREHENGDESGRDSESDSDWSSGSEIFEFEELRELKTRFDHRQMTLSYSVDNLSKEIVEKEAHIVDLQKREAEFRAMKQFYVQKLREMEEEVKMVQEQRNVLSKQVEDIEISAEEKKKHLQQSLLKKLHEKDAELQELKRKQREIAKYAKMKNADERRIQDLREEIQDKKRQKVELMRKMELEQKKFREERQERIRELSQLKKENRRNLQQIRQLVSKQEQQSKIIKRKNEEVVSAQRKLRELTKSKVQSNVVSETPNMTEVQKQQFRRKEWIQKQIQRLTQKEEAMEKLKKELSSREQILKEREELYRKQAHLRKSLNKSTFPESSLRDILLSNQTGNPFDSLSSNQMKDTIRQRLLSDEETLTLEEIEERIELAEAQLAYKDTRIRAIEQNIHEEHFEEDIDSDDEKTVDVQKNCDEKESDDFHEFGSEALLKIERSTLPKAKLWLKTLFSMLVEERRTQRTLQRQTDELAMHKEESQNEIKMMRQQLAATKIRFQKDLISEQGKNALCEFNETEIPVISLDVSSIKDETSDNPIVNYSDLLSPSKLERRSSMESISSNGSLTNALKWEKQKYMLTAAQERIRILQRLNSQTMEDKARVERQMNAMSTEFDEQSQQLERLQATQRELQREIVALRQERKVLRENIKSEKEKQTESDYTLVSSPNTTPPKSQRRKSPPRRNRNSFQDSCETQENDFVSDQGKQESVFDRLTDPSRATGVYKRRLMQNVDAQGHGRHSDERKDKEEVVKRDKHKTRLAVEKHESDTDVKRSNAQNVKRDARVQSNERNSERSSERSSEKSKRISRSVSSGRKAREDDNSYSQTKKSNNTNSNDANDSNDENVSKKDVEGVDPLGVRKLMHRMQLDGILSNSQARDENKDEASQSSRDHKDVYSRLADPSTFTGMYRQRFATSNDKKSLFSSRVPRHRSHIEPRLSQETEELDKRTSHFLTKNVFDRLTDKTNFTGVAKQIEIEKLERVKHSLPPPNAMHNDLELDFEEPLESGPDLESETLRNSL